VDGTVAVAGSVHSGQGQRERRRDRRRRSVERSEDRGDGQINEVRIAAEVWPARGLHTWRECTGWAIRFVTVRGSIDLVATLVVSALGLLTALMIAVLPAPVGGCGSRGDRALARRLRRARRAMLFVPLLVITVVILAVSIIGIPFCCSCPSASSVATRSSWGLPERPRVGRWSASGPERMPAARFAGVGLASCSRSRDRQVPRLAGIRVGDPGSVLAIASS